MLHPTVVEQFVHRAVADGFHGLVPSLASVLDGHQNGFVALVVEQRIIVHILRNLHAVNLFDNATSFHFGVFLVKGTAFHHLSDFEAVTLIIEVENHAKLSRGIATTTRRTIARTRVRHIQFAQNLTQHFGKVVIVVNVLKERLVGFLHHWQIHAVLVLHEETFLGLQENVVEHIFALGGKIEFHCGVILNRSRLAALVHLLQVATRKHKDVVAFHSQLCAALPHFLQNLHRLFAHVEFPKVVALLK